ncbi:alpha/beta fold hydrolase [Aquimarina agarivorans]|uniref:alpha/beta fold hydrolase n=1 Tax=Aquimarina agarivorans TaxID=980584 RepID=UPI0002D38FD0|nr:alpha/beta hydrolase [Aquimarina agarivorans]
MKLKSLTFFGITSLILLLNSCAVLQWRENDDEINERFSNYKIPTNIDYFEIDSLNLKIRTQHITQSSNNLNIIFFHGSPSSLSAWNGYLKDSLLIKKANLHAIDRPGYGYSNFGKELPEIEPQAEAMNQLIDYYQLKNVITIGSSYGGPLAARVAAINNNVKGVIMISPAIDPDQEKDVWGAHLTQWWLTRWLVPRGYRVAGDEKTIHAAEMKKITNEWNRVQIPIIHIHGNADDLVPYTNVNYSSEKFSSIQIVTIPNKGHEIAWKHPELILLYIYQMIDGLQHNAVPKHP